LAARQDEFKPKLQTLKTKNLPRNSAIDLVENTDIWTEKLTVDLATVEIHLKIMAAIQPDFLDTARNIVKYPFPHENPMKKLGLLLRSSFPTGFPW